MKQSPSVQFEIRRAREEAKLIRAIWAANRWAAKLAKLGWRRDGSISSAEEKTP